MAGMELSSPLADAGIPLPSWVAQGGPYTYWTDATRFGQLELCGFLREFNIRGCFGCLTVSHLFHRLPLHLPVAFCLCLFLLVLCLVVCVCLPRFASARVFLVAASQ